MAETFLHRLVRTGALEQAEKEYHRLRLDRDTSSEDIMALGGRLMKARALEATGATRMALARSAAEGYETAYKRTGGSYSGINTAALYLVAGDRPRASHIAQDLLRSLEGRPPRPGREAYHHVATQAEAQLILGRQKQASCLLADAIALWPHDYADHASTLHQFDMLLEALDAPHDWLDPFRPPKSLHFAGHLFGIGDAAGALEPSSIRMLESAIADLLVDENIGAAYGALAAGADILIAELLLSKGVELHVVQPCPDSLFVEHSIQPYGEAWLPRFKACLKAASSVRHVSTDDSLSDDLTTAFASETAMGLAVLRADLLATEAVQLLMWDGTTHGGPAGTARDAALWKKAGRRQIVVPASFERPERDRPAVQTSGRTLKAMLFADVAGFGRLSERQVPLFLEHILAPLAACCEARRDALTHVNTWGDGLFMVFETVEAAAAAAVDLQQCFLGIDLDTVGLPPHLALRVAGHYSPVHLLQDPFLTQAGFFGREVTTAARIEAVTTPGSIFVSEPFACALAISGEATFRCEPLKEKLSCRDRGDLTLFTLRRTKISAPAG
jgi:class 3 adenylate cyclase